MNLRSALRTLAFASVCALPLPAGVVTINFTEIGSDVVVTLSGSLTDSTVWLSPSASAPGSFVYPSLGAIAFSGSGTVWTVGTSNAGTWTGGFGLGSSTNASSSSGDVFAFAPFFNALVLPTTYSFSSPTNLSSTMTFTSTTIAGLGITATPVAAIYGGDTIRLTFGGSSVPDAGPGPALALLLGGLGLRQWRSSRRSRAAA